MIKWEKAQGTESDVMKEKLKKTGLVLKKACLSMVKSVWFWLIMLLPSALLLRFFAQQLSGFADGYCSSVYRIMSVFWNRVSGVIPISLGEWLLLLLPLALMVYLVFVIVKTIRSRRQRLKTAAKGLLRPIALACALYFIYVTNCGINYYCTDFASQSGLAVQPTTAEELYEVCIYLGTHATSCRSHLPENDKGVMTLDHADARRTAAEAVNRLHERYDFFPDGYSVPKPVLLSRGMSYLRITGIFFPFTFEANVNEDSSDCFIPFTMCHELAHVRGYMHEEDANFIAFLACIHSDDEAFRYSGYLMALNYASGALYEADREKYDAFVSCIGDNVRRDLTDYYDYWKQFETPVAETASAINDHYLKSNAQDSGVRSYGKMTDLVIAYYYSEPSADIQNKHKKSGKF